MDGSEGARRRFQDYMLATGQWAVRIDPTPSPERMAQLDLELERKIARGSEARQLLDPFIAAMLRAGRPELVQTTFPRRRFWWPRYHDVVAYSGWIMNSRTEGERTIFNLLTPDRRWYEVGNHVGEQFCHLNDDIQLVKRTGLRETPIRDYEWDGVWERIRRLNDAYTLGLTLVSK